MKNVYCALPLFLKHFSSNKTARLKAVFILLFFSFKWASDVFVCYE